MPVMELNFSDVEWMSFSASRDMKFRRCYLLSRQGWEGIGDNAAETSPWDTPTLSTGTTHVYNWLIHVPSDIC